MPDISALGPAGSVGPVDRVGSAGSRHDRIVEFKGGSPPTRPGDSVELSDHARYLDRLRGLPDVRQSRVEQIKASLADGTYPLAEKLDVALERALEELGEA